MYNILYIDDYINFYNNKINKIIITRPYKNTLKNGHIIDSEKFIKKFIKLLKENNLNNTIISNDIHVIINPTYTIEDKKLLKNILEELNYKNIKFIQDINYLKINKNNLFINYNESYFNIYYINNLGNINIQTYENNSYIKELIVKLIFLFKKKEVYIFGKNYLELKSILNSKKINYYYFENSDNLIINMLINM